MKIGYLQKSSFIDYPGKISAIIFTQGCNFRCGYCHNPELVDPGLFSEQIDLDDIIAFLEKRKGKIDAVVITGGEPTIHKDLPIFTKRIKDMGYLVKVDTNGTNPDILEDVISHGSVDYIAMDLKAPIEKYEYVVKVKVDRDAIASSVSMIMNSGVDYEFRTTLVRGLLVPDDILKIGDMIRGARQYVLQNFVSSKHLDKDFITANSFSVAMLAELKLKLDSMLGNVIVR